MGTIRRYQLIADALADDIRSGRTAAGTRLPTHRALAAEHGIAVVTASRVYAELEARGLVSSEQGRGTFVRDQALVHGVGIDQQSVAADAVDLSFNSPSTPGQADRLRQALRELAGSGDLDALLRYQPHRGRRSDREAITRHLHRARDLHVHPRQVLVTSGAQHALAVTAMGCLERGDLVAVDALTYPGLIVLARTLGLELAALPDGGHGPDLDALDQLCARRPVRAIYTMPTLHNPLGWVTPAPQRHTLVDLARRHNLLIVEDASYAYLSEDPPPPLAATAPDITIYVSGLSKNLATGLRVGFLVAPDQHTDDLERAIRATTWNTPALTTTLATRWLDDGTVEHLESRRRHDARERQVIAGHALGGLTTRGHPSSYFLWLPLPDHTRADRIATALAEQRISVSTAAPFATTPAPQALRLALGSIDTDELHRTITQVRDAVNDDLDH